LSAGDKGVLAVMVGIPTLIQLVLVWIPLVLSIALSFTRWNALALSDIKSAGLSNYDFVLNNYPPFWPAVEHNIIWLLFLAVVATPLGLFLAVLLDQNIRGSRIYQSVFFTPVMLSLPLVAIIWQLMYARHCQRPERHRLVRRLEHQLVGRTDRRHLAACRLHHGALSGRPQGH
jgi:ABC-type sugar transport system permease subunit